jgi:hypothetical protein
MSFFQKLFREPEPGPFMEHPTGDFKSAIDAMEDAIRRLRGLKNWDKWIAFNAQGEGSEPDSEAFAEVRMLQDKLDVGEKALDVARIVSAARVGTQSLVANGAHYSVAAASPREVAQIFDAIFRQHFGLRPFADQGGDYAVGAEW